MHRACSSIQIRSVSEDDFSLTLFGF